MSYHVGCYYHMGPYWVQVTVSQAFQKGLHIFNSRRLLSKEFAQLLKAHCRPSHVRPLDIRLTVSPLTEEGERGEMYIW